MTPRKLTDTQLVLLSAAAQRQDGAIELTGKPKPAVARKALTTLLTDGLVEEVPAGSTLPVWRRDDDQGALALRITARGLAALGLETSASPDVAVTSGATEPPSPRCQLARPRRNDPQPALASTAGARPHAGKGPSNLASSRCSDGNRAAPSPRSSKQRAGSRIPCAGSSRAWCERSSASRSFRRRWAGSGCTASSSRIQGAGAKAAVKPPDGLPDRASDRPNGRGARHWIRVTCDAA